MPTSRQCPEWLRPVPRRQTIGGQIARVSEIRANPRPLHASVIRVLTDPHTLLIVDDDAAAHAYLAQALRRLQIDERILHAHTGEQAIEVLGNAALNAAPPFLAFIDLRLPGIDGFQLLDWIHARPAFLRMITVVMSGFVTKEGCARAYQLGSFTCFDKYPDDEELRSVYDVAKARSVRDRKAQLGH